MAHVVFTANLRRHVDCPEVDVDGGTVREVLERLFAERPAIRGYVLDDQGALRKHMAVFVDGERIRDRTHLAVAVRPESRIHVVQALSGG